MRRTTCAYLFLVGWLGIGGMGCDLFATRTPELPEGVGGTFLQPDTPDQVIENLRFAINERNTLNYRRSLADDLQFQPTASAEAQHPIWSGWSATEEESYFTTLASSIAGTATQNVVLNDVTLTIIDTENSVFDATYLITTEHSRPEIPTIFQGRLSWMITQRSDGLWILQSWIDQEVGAEPSWSDLKAAFAS